MEIKDIINWTQRLDNRLMEVEKKRPSEAQVIPNEKVEKKLDTFILEMTKLVNNLDKNINKSIEDIESFMFGLERRIKKLEEQKDGPQQPQFTQPQPGKLSRIINIFRR
jgi:predicted FMN-binding regulatory protein PaiB